MSCQIKKESNADLLYRKLEFRMLFGCSVCDGSDSDDNELLDKMTFNRT